MPSRSTRPGLARETTSRHGTYGRDSIPTEKPFAPPKVASRRQLAENATQCFAKLGNYSIKGGLRLNHEIRWRRPKLASGIRVRIAGPSCRNTRSPTAACRRQRRGRLSGPRTATAGEAEHPVVAVARTATAERPSWTPTSRTCRARTDRSTAKAAAARWARRAGAGTTTGDTRDPGRRVPQLDQREPDLAESQGRWARVCRRDRWCPRSAVCQWERRESAADRKEHRQSDRGEARRA